MTGADLGFDHVYREPQRAGAPTLLLLHGTGGDERDLLPVAGMVDPSAGVLSPRGRVLENGMPRFFRRLAEGVFDEEDVKLRAAELAAFVAAASAQYQFDARRVIAVGFSNGANIASALLLLVPRALAGAVLLRAMVPLVPDVRPTLDGVRVLISNGRSDPIVKPRESERLAALLRGAGAEVDLVWQAGGHQLTSADISAVQAWLQRIPTL